MHALHYNISHEIIIILYRNIINHNKQNTKISRTPIQNKPNVLITLNMTPFIKKEKEKKRQHIVST